MIKLLRKYIFDKVIKNSLWLIVDKFIRLIGGLVVGAWIARYLGPEQYGLMNFVVAYSLIFTSFSMLGIDNLVIRNLSKKNANTSEILGTAVRIRNIGSFFSAVISVIIGFIFYYQDNNSFIYLLIILMIGNIFQSFDVISLWYQSRIEAKKIILNKLIAYILIMILKIIAVYLKVNIIVFVSLNVLELILGVFLLLRWSIIKDKINIKEWVYSSKCAKNFLIEGWKLAISNFCIIVFMKIDQIFLGTLMGTKEVGIYSVATLISDILYSIPMFVTASILPKITSLYEENRELYMIYIEKIFLGMVIYSYIMILGIYLFIDIFINFFYGQSYILSGNIAKIHSLTLLFVSIGCIRGNMLIVEHKTLELSIITIIGGCMNIALNYIFINKYGLYGAAIAILISQAIVSYFSGIFYKSLRNIFFIQTKAILLNFLWKKIFSSNNNY
ncbi:flippase [Megamonas hypermegale]|uniref:flippase n=1 Tax=Megamonas hypermegale TaxID=158847 RepID=UPI00195ADC7C|nr:flippase [Megamonas hypermegale]MBM6761417.1 flippase [Megamonas hypermegale]